MQVFFIYVGIFYRGDSEPEHQLQTSLNFEKLGIWFTFFIWRSVEDIGCIYTYAEEVKQFCQLVTEER